MADIASTQTTAPLQHPSVQTLEYRNESLQTLPPEIQGEIVWLVHSAHEGRKTLIALGSTNRQLRIVCMPLIFSSLSIELRSNLSIKSFISTGLPIIGRFVKQLDFCRDHILSVVRIDIPPHHRPCPCCKGIYDQWEDERETLIRELVLALPNLATLNLEFPNDYYNPHTSQVRSRFETLIQITYHLPTLRHLRLRFSPHTLFLLDLVHISPEILSIKIDLPLYITATAVPLSWWQAALASSVTSLDLGGFKELSPNTIHALTHNAPRGPFTRRPPLKKLSLRYFDVHFESVIALLHAFGGAELQELHMDFRSTGVNAQPSLIPRDSTPFPRLTLLNIEDIEKISSPDFEALIQFFAHSNTPLRRLHVDGRWRRRDFRYLVTSRVLPHLEYIRYYSRYYLPSNYSDPNRPDIAEGWPRSGDLNWGHMDAQHAREMCSMHGIHLEVLVT